MAINALYKGVALLGGAGSVVGGYVLVSHLSTGKEKENKVTSIKDRLKNEGYKLLDFSNTTSDGWDKIKKAYKEENSEDKRFSNVDHDSDHTLTGISSSCLKYLEGDSNNEDDYKMSRRWCIVTMAVKDKLGVNNLLKSGASVTDDDTKWDEVVKKNDSKQNNKFVTFSQGNESNENKRTEIKKQCEAKSNIETTKEEFEEALKQVNLWCTQAAGTA